MTVVYGISLPPNLTAPTRGELVVKIESFVLQEGLLADSGLATHPAVAGAFGDTTAAAAGGGGGGGEGAALKTFLEQRCCISPQFWGESKPTVQAFPPTPSATTEADGTTPRTVVTGKYPVKTLPAQLEQYFRHMTLSSMGGLPVHVLIPATKIGKKRDAILGTATIAMTALSPTTPISGWFTLCTTKVVAANESESADGGSVEVAIGRVKLTIALTFFAHSVGAKTDEKQNNQKGKGPFLPVHDAPPSDPSISAPPPPHPTHHGLNTSSKNSPPSSEPPAGRGAHSGTSATVTTPHVASKPILIPPSYRLAAEHEASLAAARHLATSTQHQPVHQRNEAIQHDKEFQNKFQLLLQRGEQLRDSIAHAAGRTGESAIELTLASRRQQQRAAAQQRHQATLTSSRFSNNITGVEHRLAGRQSGVVLPGHARFGHDEDYSDGDMSSDSDMMVVGADDRGRMGNDGALMGPRHLVGGMYRSPSTHTDNHPHSAEYTNAVSPSRVYDRATCLVEIMLQGFSFSEPVEEIRVQVRTSPDVMCSSPFDALSSFVHFIGKDSDGEGHQVRIPLSFETTSFSSDSKVVLECFAVKSKPIVLTKQFRHGHHRQIPSNSSNPNDRVLLSERLLGVVFLGVYSAANRVIKFHDPLTGTNPVECFTEVRVHQNVDGVDHNTSDSSPSRLIPDGLRHAQQRKQRGADSASSPARTPSPSKGPATAAAPTTEWNPAGYTFARASYQREVERKPSTVQKGKRESHSRRRRHTKGGRRRRSRRSESMTSTTSFTSTMSEDSKSTSHESVSSASSTSTTSSEEKELLPRPLSIRTDVRGCERVANDEEGDDEAARFREENKRRFEQLRDGVGSPTPSLPLSPNGSYADGRRNSSGNKPPMPLGPLSPSSLSQRPPPSPTSQPLRVPQQPAPHQRGGGASASGAITIPVQVSRLHVSIKAAKALPNVRCGGRASSSKWEEDSSMMTMMESGPSSPSTSSVPHFNSTPDHVPPHSFCVVEDLIYEDSPASGATFPAATVSRGSAPTASSVLEGSGDGGSGPCTVFREFLQRIEDREKAFAEEYKARNGNTNTPPPSHWSVEAAVRGHYDRTLVVADSNKPVYNYECSLGVTLPHAQQRAATATKLSTSALNPPYNPNANRDAHSEDPLRHLQGILISVWHSQPQPAAGTSSPSLGVQQGGSPKIANAGTPSSSHNTNAERVFWERGCRLGTCFVDLRPMKYYPTVDGWYRVYSDSHSLDTTIGYVHVAVRKVT